MLGAEACRKGLILYIHVYFIYSTGTHEGQSAGIVVLGKSEESEEIRVLDHRIIAVVTLRWKHDIKPYRP